MTILIPTFEPRLELVEVTGSLLKRYWPGCPPVRQVLMRSSAWLGEVAKAVEDLSDALFILLLDDYAACGPIQTGSTSRAVEVMGKDPTIGMFPLCWYPARLRQRDPSHEGVVRLTGAPVLLQAAIWRRDFFLDLANDIDPRASAWGFEHAATQKIHSHSPVGICAIDQPEPPWLGGHFIDGFDKTHWPLPYHNLFHRGRPAPEHEPFLRAHGLSFPSRGVGDSIANLTRALGLHPKPDCGCSRRREWLNEKVPYR